MHKYFHIFIKPKDGVSIDQVEKKMDLALDWFRYSNNIYIVYTKVDINRLYNRFKNLVEPKGNLFICELNISVRKGWMNYGFWNWLQKERA